MNQHCILFGPHQSLSPVYRQWSITELLLLNIAGQEQSNTLDSLAYATRFEPHSNSSFAQGRFARPLSTPDPRGAGVSATRANSSIKDLQSGI